jgi:Bifunctional DNA primase/polymerase, N-terminal
VSAAFETARDTAAHGLRVFPCHSIGTGGRCTCGRPGCKSPGKHPRTRHGFDEATADERGLLHWNDRWPDANWALVCDRVSVIDCDAKAGADMREVIAEHDLDGRPTVWTGEALTGPLEGERGGHVYCAAGARTGQTAVDGVEVRGLGSYVLLPGSRHISGVAYEWASDARPWTVLLEPLPPALIPQAAGVGEQRPLEPGARVPHHQRHPHLKDFSIRLARAGVTDQRTILAHLQTEFRERCVQTPPPERGSLEKLAAWAASSRIAGRERAQNDGQPDIAPCPLPEVVATFKRWLYLPDPRGLYAVLGTIAANLLDGDPVWLVLVAAPSSGKSELLTPTNGLPYIHPAATLTEAALLSGTPKRERASGARGGLLRALGDFGILMCKDFGSVLSMDRTERAKVLGALREVYDGSWTRHLGSEGGKTLHWEGKAGLLAGATPALDRHRAVMSAMGERFLIFRLETLDAAEQARFSLKRARGGSPREQLSDAVAGLFAGELAAPRTLQNADTERLIGLAVLVAKARSAVDRDPYSHEIELIPDSEAPPRLALQLRGLLDGLDAIGVNRETAWTIIAKTALDSIPALRRATLTALAADEMNTTQVAEQICHPTVTARRTLEDLVGHGVVLRASQGPGKADLWRLAEWVDSDLLRNVGNTPSSSLTTPKHSYNQQTGEGPEELL